MTGHARLASATLAAVGVLTLTACGSGAAASPQGSSPPATSASATAPHYRVDPPTVADAPYNAQAAKAFGDTKVYAAYQEAVQFASTMIVEAPRVFTHTPQVSLADFADVTAYMSPSEKATFDDLVTKSIAENGDGPASQRVAFSALFGTNDTQGNPFTARPDGLLVTDQKVTNPSISVDDKNRLVISFHHETTFHFLDQGKPGYASYARDIAYPMVPAPAGGKYQMLLDADEGSGKFTAVGYDDGSPMPSATSRSPGTP